MRQSTQLKPLVFGRPHIYIKLLKQRLGIVGVVDTVDIFLVETKAGSEVLRSTFVCRSSWM